MIRRGIALIPAVIVVGTVVAAIPAEAYPRPGDTERVSVSTGGGESSGASMAPAVSADGRYVAFQSSGPNLVAGDTNAVADVFVKDRISGTTERVSVASDEAEGERASTAPAISADGRYVAFVSASANLVPGDTNGAADVLVHDRVADTTERVSIASAGTQGNRASGAPSISADGRFVAFRSAASNLVADDSNVVWDVFVRDRVAGTTERVSLSSGGSEGNGWSDVPAISADGRFVAFQSRATNFLPGTPAGQSGYVRDRTTNTTKRIGPTTGTLDISGDGRFVAFASASTTLVPGDSNKRVDVFVWDRDTGRTERVSVGSDGTQADEVSADAAISVDGRFVAFRSDATNLAPDDVNEVGDVFVHDRVARSTERVLSSVGIEPDGHSRDAALSADGRFVAFRSDATNLDVNDTNAVGDVFVRDRGALLGVVGPMSLQKVSGGIEVIGAAAISGIPISVGGDPDDDGQSVGPVTADDLGAEVTGASLVYRPEDEDLLVRLQLTSLPGRQGCTPLITSGGEPTYCALSGMPGVVHGLQLEAGGTRFEARIRTRSEVGCVPFVFDGQVCTFTGGSEAALYRCDLACVEEASLPGAVGNTGTEVLVSVPLVEVPAESGAALTGLRVYTSAGDSHTGETALLDAVDLSDAVIPTVRAELGIAPSSTPESQVAYSATAPIVRGEFAGTVNSASLPAGNYRVWARVCTGADCGPAVGKQVTL